MQRCRLELSVNCVINFRIRSSEEEETAESLIERINEGYAPTWIEELIKKNLQFDQISVDQFSITGDEPAPDEELNFDY